MRFCNHVRRQRIGKHYLTWQVRDLYPNCDYTYSGKIVCLVDFNDDLKQQ